MDALRKLYPQIVTTNGEDAFDANGNPVQYDKAAVEAYVKSQEYKYLRAAEYPSYADQLDTIFHQGLDAWKAEIQAIKDKYPKGA
jgi:hypothetical protein